MAEENTRMKLGRWFEVELGDGGVPLSKYDNRPYRHEVLDADPFLGVVRGDEIHDALMEHIKSKTKMPEELLQKLREKAERDDESWERRQEFMRSSGLNFEAIYERIERAPIADSFAREADLRCEGIWERGMRGELSPADLSTGRWARYDVSFTYKGMELARLVLGGQPGEILRQNAILGGLPHPTLVEILEKRYSRRSFSTGMHYYENFDKAPTYSPEDHLEVLRRVAGNDGIPGHFGITISGFLRNGSFIEADGSMRRRPLFIYQNAQLYYGVRELPKGLGERLPGGHACNAHCNSFWGVHAVAVPRDSAVYAGIYAMLEKKNPVAAKREADMDELKGKGGIKAPKVERAAPETAGGLSPRGRGRMRHS